MTRYGSTQYQTLVCNWHLTDIYPPPPDVRFRGQADIAKVAAMSAFDHSGHRTTPPLALPKYSFEPLRCLVLGLEEGMRRRDFIAALGARRRHGRTRRALSIRRCRWSGFLSGRSQEESAGDGRSVPRGLNEMDMSRAATLRSNTAGPRGTMNGCPSWRLTCAARSCGDSRRGR
jgi:hypothetical protein